MVRGDLAPTSFNRAWLVLIPKALVALDQCCPRCELGESSAAYAEQRLPEDCIAHSAVHQAQGRCARGRQMASKLVGADAAIERFLHDPRSDLGLVLLDIQAVFLSIDWAGMQWVLLRMGVPRWLIDCMFSTSHGLEVLLHGQRSGAKLRVTRSIKEGFSASGCIWPLAYDPIIRCLVSLRPHADLRGCVFADDIGLATRRVVECLRVVCPFFLLVLRSAGIGLH